MQDRQCITCTALQFHLLDTRFSGQTYAICQMQAELLYLCLTHVALQEVVVHDYGGVLDVEVTGHPTQLSDIQVPALLIKTCHLALLQLTRSITHQSLPAYTQTTQ